MLKICIIISVIATILYIAFSIGEKVLVKKNEKRGATNAGDYNSDRGDDNDCSGSDSDLDAGDDPTNI